MLVHLIVIAPKLTHPKLLDGFNCKPKGKDNKKGKSWSAVPSS